MFWQIRHVHLSTYSTYIKVFIYNWFVIVEEEEKAELKTRQHPHHLKTDAARGQKCLNSFLIYVN